MTPIERYAYQTGKYDKFSQFTFQPENEIDRFVISLVETRDKRRLLLDERQLEQQKQAIAKDIVKEVQKEFQKAFKN